MALIRRRPGSHWLNQALLAVGGGLALLALAGGYVFVLGAPQLDRPAVEEANTGMTFKLESFPRFHPANANSYASTWMLVSMISAAL